MVEYLELPCRQKQRSSSFQPPHGDQQSMPFQDLMNDKLVLWPWFDVTDSTALRHYNLDWMLW